MKTSRRVAKNFLSLTGAEAISRVLGAVLNIYVARILGVAIFGQLNFALAVSSYLNIFTDLGLTMFGIREIAKDKTRLSFFASHILFLQTAVALSLAILLGLVLLVLPLDPALKWITWLFGLSAIPVAVNVSYVFQAYESMEFAAVVRVMGQLGYVILGFILIWLLRDILVLPIASVVAYFAAASLSVLLIRRQYHFMFERVDWAQLMQLLRLGLPFVLIGLSVQIYFNADSILLQFMKGSQDVGFYNAGYKLINLLILGSNLLLGVFYPLLVSTFNQDRGRFEQANRYLSRISGMAALPIAAGGYLLANGIIVTIYGSSYDPGSLAFSILALTIPFIFLNGVLGTLINATGSQAKLTIATAVGAVFNVVVNLWVIPQYGFNGAALVTLLTEALVLIVILASARNYQFDIGSSIRSFIVRPVLPTVLMSLTLLTLQLYNPAVIWSVLVGVVAYIAGLFIFRVLHPSDVREIIGMVQR